MDASLNHCLAIGKSLTGCLHFVNKILVHWYSKKQATVETAKYGSEFVAAKTATEQIMDIRQWRIVRWDEKSTAQSSVARY